MFSKKSILPILLCIVCAFTKAKAEDRYAYFNKWPKVKYHFALHAYSPLSAFYKIGTSVEYRRHFISYKASYFKYYGVQSIPFNYLVDPSGNIIARDLRGDQLEAMLSATIK